MRDILLPIVQDTDTGVFLVSQELPFTVDGIALFVKNPKRIYVDMAQSQQTSIANTLDNGSIVLENTQIKVYMSCESKVVAGYTEAIDNLKLLVDDDELKEWSQRSVNVLTRYDSNLLITELTYQFRKLL
jgi:hypothetical protein